jgi:hypothetical protein
MENFFEKIKKMTTRDWTTAVDMYVDEAIRLTNSQIGYFAILSWTEDELTMLGWSKSAMDACKSITKPIRYKLVETGLWGDCVRERKPVVTNDYAGSIRPNKKGYPKGHVQVVRHMNVPIHHGVKIRGIMGVGNKTADYSALDAETLQRFANEGWEAMGKILAL